MSVQLCPEGYYQTSGLVSGQLADLNDKDVMVLTFGGIWDPNANQVTEKKVFLYFTGGAAEISDKALAKLGCDYKPDKDGFCQFSNPQAIQQLKCEYYFDPKKNGQATEQWRLSGGFSAAPTDRAARWSAARRAGAATAQRPSGRPTAPPTQSAPPAASTPAPQQRPSAPPPTDPAPRPASSGPPPADDTPPQVWDKDAAWLKWDQAAAAHGKSADVQAWKKTIEEVKKQTGKVETQFGSEEWKIVAEASEIPF